MLLGIDASQANRQIRSGTEWYAFYLIQEFKKLLADRTGVSVVLYCRDEPRSDLAADLPANFSFKILRWPFKYFWVQGRLSLQMILRPPDILFCPAHTIPLISPKKTFTTLHDIGFEDYPELYDKLSLWYHRFSARLAIRKAYHIFTVSNFSKSRIIEHYNYPADKVSVTYLGIAGNWTNHKGSGILDKHDLENKKYLLYMGRLEPKKNILNMVRAFEESAFDGYFILAGKEINIKDVDEYLKERAKLASRIKFLGHVSELEKRDLYAHAVLFLFTTLYEGFGLPILEAQSMGVPVLTSDTASNPEIAGKGALTVDPESWYETAQAIDKILSDETLKKNLIALGRENVSQFSWSKTAQQTLQKIL